MSLLLATTPCFIPGAYVIRNKIKRLVLHTDEVYFEHDSSVCATNLEVKFWNQQTWWIEPLPNTGKKADLIYSITNPASGRALTIIPGGELDAAYNITAAENRGETWQKWNIKKVTDDRADPYFAISSVFNGQTIAAKLDSTDIHSQRYDRENDLHGWEFVIPTVMFPPGWFRIQNSGTGDLLSHTYTCNPPLLLPTPESPRLSEYRESWEFQWTLAHSWCYNMHVGAYINSWRIINRLTRVGLSPRFGDETPETLSGHGHEFDWELELDPSYRWKLRNRATSCFLTQAGSEGSIRKSVVCDEKMFTMEGGSKSWVFISMRRMDDPNIQPAEVKPTVQSHPGPVV